MARPKPAPVPQVLATYKIRAADSENWNVISLYVDAYSPRQALEIFVREERAILKSCHLPLIYEVFDKDKTRKIKTTENLAGQVL